MGVSHGHYSFLPHSKIYKIAHILYVCETGILDYENTFLTPLLMCGVRKLALYYNYK